jgi:dTDP-4-dehydrorhamnose 3,5-epimerase
MADQRRCAMGTTMQVEALSIPDVLTITPIRHGDERGFFSETYNLRAFAAHGITMPFVQDNHSLSVQRGTVRGLHFQKPPHAQAKLVRVIRGAVYDVAVDLRGGSPTYGSYAGATLSAENGMQLYVPIGFAHGFCTLEDHTEVVYKVTDFYSREHDAAVAWLDPTIAIPWPFEADRIQVSEKDAAAPRLAEIETPFLYG